MALLDLLYRLIPQRERARVGLRSEPINLSASATVATIQAALRTAERGDTKDLFTLYRDSLLGDTHIQSEFGKRKMAVLAQPHSIQPFDKTNADDKKAAAAVEDMISHCEAWTDGLIALMDATLWPVTVIEKVFAPAENADPNRPRLQYALSRLAPVNPTLLCFREPLALKPVLAGGPEPWEPRLRIYATDDTGRILWEENKAYHVERATHIVHRGHLLTGVRDNFGGPMRAILFWWFLRAVGRDWFARTMERYNSPFLVGKTDAANQEAVTLLQDAFSLSTKIGGLVVDHDTQVELVEAAVSGTADAHERFKAVCDREISRAIVGQELSSTAQATGLGSGVARLQGQVRDDIEAFDKLKLGETLRCQLFTQFLYINGLKGRPPKIVWGATSPEEAEGVSKVLVNLSQAGLEPTDEALEQISDRVGFQLQRKPATPAAGPGMPAPTDPETHPEDTGDPAPNPEKEPAEDPEDPAPAE